MSAKKMKSGANSKIWQWRKIAKKGVKYPLKNEMIYYIIYKR